MNLRVWVGLGLIPIVAPLISAQTPESASPSSPSASPPTGPHPIASGANALATGEYSVASGDTAAATNYYARATGWWSTASGGYAVASGFMSSASADYTLASGYTSIASSGFASAPGYFSVATGWYSTAANDYTTASGHFSRAWGYAATAGAPGHFATVQNKVVTPFRTINEGPAEVDLRAYYAPGDEIQLAPGAMGFDYFPSATPEGRAQLPELFTVASVTPEEIHLTKAPGPQWPRAFVSNLSRGMHQEAHAAGTFDGNDRSGDAQASRYLARGVTFDATPVRLTANGLEPAANNAIRLKRGQAIAFTLSVVAQRDNGDAASFHRQILLKCSPEGVTSLVGAAQSATPDLADDAARGWSISIAADDEGDALDLRVKGADGHIIRWVASLQATEVGWFPARPTSARADPSAR